MRALHKIHHSLRQVLEMKLLSVYCFEASANDGVALLEGDRCLQPNSLTTSKT